MDKEDDYIPRLVDREIKEKLRSFGAINIKGCKWCGKTKTAKHFAKSFIELQNPENSSLIPLIKSQPSLALKGETPRLIDEWQDAKEIWDAVRYDVDDSSKLGKYILTGSATPRKEDAPKHSGAGRIATVTMRPMSLFESGDSSGEISLSSLFKKKKSTFFGVSNYKLEDIARLCSRGGWPTSVIHKTKNPLLLPREYLVAIINREESFGELEYYSAGRMKALLRSLARNTATPIKISTTVADIKENTGTSISNVTLANYLSVLEQIHLIDEVEAWCPRLRSKTEIRTTKKRFFVDPSLAVASLYASENDLLADPNTFGFIFETMVLRDLKTYAGAIDGELLYYRDSNGLEADAIIHLANGQWGAIEIKLGSDKDTIDQAASDLISLSELIDDKKMPAPSFLLIISGDASYAYRREDGVYVAPVGCLRD